MKNYLRALLALTSGLIPLATTVAEDRPPNIIIFMTDDQSPMSWEYDGLIVPAAWGYTGAKVYSPNVDRLAANGMVFNRAYVSSTVCTPSRYTTLTGRYAGRSTGERFMRLHPPGTMTRVENVVELDPSGELNLPKILQNNGYKTGFVGKSHIVDHDILDYPDRWHLHGLNYYEQDADPRDPEVNAKMNHNHDWWRERIAPYGFDYVNAVYAGNLRELFNNELNVHNIEWTTKAALEFIERSGDDPFFLYFAPTLPHGPDPWVKNPQGEYLYSIHADPDMTGEGYVPADYPFMPSRLEILATVKEKGYPGDHAYITLMDASLGALVDKLEAMDMLENTVLIVTSDHGAWRYGKTTLYEGGTRVPLVFHWPKGIERGSMYDHLVSNIDHAPTVLGLTKSDVPEDYQMDGIDLTPILQGAEKGPVRNSIFAEIGYSRGVLTADGWKYIAIRYPEDVQRHIDNGEPFQTFMGRPMPEGRFEGLAPDEMAQPYLVRNPHLGYFSSLHNANYFELDQLYNIYIDPEELNNLADKFPQKVKAMKELLAEYLRSFPDRPFGKFAR